MAENIIKELDVNVFGYEDVKKELNMIKSWFEDETILNNDKITLPKGILLYGHPGCGKTLLIREFSKSFKVPTYVIKGKETNVVEEVEQVFQKAKEDKFALVLIDEIDLLIGKNSLLCRTLQNELDGIETKGKILVLATTNNEETLPEALKRPGRFDRLIEIGYPDIDSRMKIYQKFLSELDIPYEKIDLKHVAKVSHGCSGAEIKAICNDVYLRCKDNVTAVDLERSYERIHYDRYAEDSPANKDMRVAVHEVGHSLMALHCKDNHSFYCAKFSETGGSTEINEVDENKDCIKKREESIMIGLAGYLAEEVVYGNHDIGSYYDYQKVVDMCDRLITRACIDGIDDLIPTYRNNDTRYETPAKRARLEKKTYKLVNKFVRIVRKWLQEHADLIKKLADFMFENGRFTYLDIDKFEELKNI